MVRVHWLPAVHTTPGQLGLAPLPGWHSGALAEDMADLQAHGITHVVCLIRDDEFEGYGVPGLLGAYAEAGLAVRRLPIEDGSVPTLDEMQDLIAWLIEQMQTGARVLVHCVGGLGRTGTVAACYLTTRGLHPLAAITEVRRIRDPRAVEYRVQEEFVARFAAENHRA